MRSVRCVSNPHVIKHLLNRRLRFSCLLKSTKTLFRNLRKGSEKGVRPCHLLFIIYYLRFIILSRPVGHSQANLLFSIYDPFGYGSLKCEVQHGQLNRTNPAPQYHISAHIRDANTAATIPPTRRLPRDYRRN